jgi:hypothetical protein
MGQGKKLKIGNMGNDHNSKVIIFQGFAIHSTPLVVALMGFADYRPTSTTLVVPLMTLPTTFNTS